MEYSAFLCRNNFQGQIVWRNLNLGEKKIKNKCGYAVVYARFFMIMCATNIVPNFWFTILKVKMASG